MNYIFDASSVFKAIKEAAPEAVAGRYTLELARYELGNILWKEYGARGKATDEELKRLARLVKDVLNLMEAVTIGCHEEQILDLARQLRLTFYDASYVYYARDLGLPLVTEDSDLIDKARSQVKALKLDSIL